MHKTLRVSQVQKLSGLQVRQELLGAEHRFVVGDTPAYLRLPDFAGVRPGGQEVAYQAVEWFGGEPGAPGTTWYEVLNCHSGLLVAWGAEDLAILRKPKSEPKRHGLQSLANSLMPTIWAAWARTLFWVSQEYQIYSAPEVPVGGVRGGYGLHVDDDGERLNSLGYVIMLDKGGKVTPDIWNAMQAIFDEGKTPPLWFNYLFDSYRNLAAGNATGAVISAAVACETAIRGLFWKTVPGVTHPTAARIIDNVSVQQLLTRWGELTGSSKQEMDKVGKKKVHTLFDRRNAAMHYGTVMDDAVEVHSLVSSARDFIIDTDKRICALSGDTHRPLGGAA